jgi:hypothetical protein
MVGTDTEKVFATSSLGLPVSRRLRDTGRFFSATRFPERSASSSLLAVSSLAQAAALPEVLAAHHPEPVGEPETLIVGSALLKVLHPRQVKRSAGFERARAGERTQPPSPSSFLQRYATARSLWATASRSPSSGEQIP